MRNNFDDKLADALHKEADAHYAPGREETLRSMVAESFRGKKKWLSMVAYIYVLLFSAVGIFAAVKFFGATGTRNQILYAALFTWAMILVPILKIWYWEQLNKNAILRELKRIELRLLELGGGAARDEDQR